MGKIDILGYPGVYNNCKRYNFIFNICCVKESLYISKLHRRHLYYPPNIPNCCSTTTFHERIIQRIILNFKLITWLKAYKLRIFWKQEINSLSCLEEFNIPSLNCNYWKGVHMTCTGLTASSTSLLNLFFFIYQFGKNKCLVLVQYRTTDASVLKSIM